MRQLWRAAAGRLDLEVAGKAFLIGLFGGRVDEATLAALHPLRGLEATPGTATGQRPAGEPKPMTAAERAVFDELTGG